MRVNLLSRDDLDALGWVDLPASGERQPPAAKPESAPFYLGVVDVAQRGVAGPVSLEVMLAGATVEIGPHALTVDHAKRLHVLLGLALELQAGRPAVAALVAAQTRLIGERRYDAARTFQLRSRGLTRNASGQALDPPWEGETLP
ncbi:MAG: hypothetical protein U1F59_09825 [Candidatus Competibacteraceae bacterium]